MKDAGLLAICYKFVYNYSISQKPRHKNHEEKNMSTTENMNTESEEKNMSTTKNMDNFDEVTENEGAGIAGD